MILSIARRVIERGEDVVERCARAVRRRKFERTGRLKSFDGNVPLLPEELETPALFSPP